MVRALIVFDSLYGNTEKVARAIGAAMGPPGIVDAVSPRHVNPATLKPIKLLVLGTPTQGGRPMPTIKEFLLKLPDNALNGIHVAAFDTRMTGWVPRLFGYPGKRMVDGLTAKGGRLLIEPEGFLVKDKEGPLAEGELERAAEWAKMLVSLLPQE